MPGLHRRERGHLERPPAEGRHALRDAEGIHRRRDAARHHDHHRPAGGTPFTDPDLGFVASQPDATFECQLDGGGWARAPRRSTTPRLSESTHTFQVRAVDPAGNVDPTPASATWTVDTTLPAVTLTTPANGTATSDTTPDLGGAAGNAPGDSTDVTVKILRPVAGAPDELVQTLTTPAPAPRWSVAPTRRCRTGPTGCTPSRRMGSRRGLQRGAHIQGRHDGTRRGRARAAHRLRDQRHDAAALGQRRPRHRRHTDVTVKLWPARARAGRRRRPPPRPSTRPATGPSTRRPRSPTAHTRCAPSSSTTRATSA